MARAGGKIILLGEHAVVYGVPAIAAGIARGAEAEASTAPRAVLEIERLGRFRSGEPHDTARAFSALLAALSAPPCAVRARLELPPGCGLGGSAALGVAIARAVLDHLGTPHEAEDARVLKATEAWETVFHGNPSGIDAAAAARGGCIQFRRGHPPEPLPVKVALTVAICLAGPASSTREMVAGVARLRERRPQVVDKALEGIHALVKNARLAIGAGDLPALGRLLDLNQMLLSGLFVSTESIERCCSLARDAGALGAKLTGAGGGGAVLALIDGDATPVLDAWHAAGFEAFETRVAATP